jgi:hypothetical protein
MVRWGKRGTGPGVPTSLLRRSPAVGRCMTSAAAKGGRAGLFNGATGSASEHVCAVRALCSEQFCLQIPELTVRTGRWVALAGDVSAVRSSAERNCPANARAIEGGVRPRPLINRTGFFSAVDQFIVLHPKWRRFHTQLDGLGGTSTGSLTSFDADGVLQFFVYAMCRYVGSGFDHNRDPHFDDPKRRQGPVVFARYKRRRHDLARDRPRGIPIRDRARHLHSPQARG